MWFNNALMYQYSMDQNTDLAAALAEDFLKPCPPHARFIYGWLPAFAEELIHEVAGSRLICMAKEERILPRGVITKLLAEKIQLLESQHNRKIKRAEKAQMAEDLEFELLPKSFCVQKKMYAILDSMSNTLIVNAGSRNQASQLLSLLRKSITGLTIEPIAPDDNLALRFAGWINAPETLPEQFQLASDCLLFSLDDESKRINCKGYELPAAEIVSLLSQGMATAEISLIWREKIQFTLTQDFTFKRLKSLDYLIDEFNEIKGFEEAYQQQDAALTLLTGEFRELVADLLVALSPVNKAQVTVTEEAVEACPF